MGYNCQVAIISYRVRLNIAENIIAVNRQSGKFYLSERCPMDSVIYVRIKELCAERDITLAKLEEETGLSSSIIRKWKNNTSPSIDKVKVIARYFNVSTDYLVGLSDISTPAEELIGDEDFVSLQRAKSRMSPQDRDKMMRMLKLGFEYAFDTK